MDEKLYRRIYRFFTNRLFIMTLFITGIFMMLVLRLYELQIINGEMYATSVDTNTARFISLPAMRGNIYDRFGRPLAVNTASFCVKVDPSIAVPDPNAVISKLLILFEKNDVDYIDELPITKDEPYEFTFTSASAEERWKKDMGLEKEKLKYSAAETIEYLREFFGISPELPNIEIRNMVSIRSALFMQRFRQYNTITLAKNVSQSVMVDIEEKGEEYPGVFIELEALRHYPEGEYFSHILGYIRPINDEEYELYKDKGYTESDLVGKLGIEKAYELTLSGEKGQQRVMVSTRGKVVNKTVIVPAKNGDSVFLTLDTSLQKKTANILLENLRELLISKLDSGEITLKQLFISMVNSNNVSLKSIMNAEEGSAQHIFKDKILSDNPEFDMKNLRDLNSDDVKRAKEIIAESIEKNTITVSGFILCLIEQGIITNDSETQQKLQNSTAAPLRIIKDKIASGEISPSDTNLDPCTGSVTVVDVQTGEVLALVTYPSYDNNMLVNNFNNEYYQQLLNDPTTPMVNRPLAERKAPGSTFKMLSAIAGLESGAITPNTKIQDLGEFTKANKPYAKCLIYSRYGTTHGAVDVSKAIEVSCNYFFYEMAYRMGNAKEGTTFGSIAKFNDYMRIFGLDDYSGVEIEEYRPKMATPEAKEAANGERWTDGDAIRSAIGQCVNSYAAIHMAKYIATVANGGTRNTMHLVGGVKDPYTGEIHKTEQIVEGIVDIKPENLKAVHEGMLGVTSGSQGTLRNIFADFPIEVAGKTGTAEESNKRPSHTWFTGFAPYDDPVIAVVVMIPFGEATPSPAPKIAKEIIAEYFSLYSEPDRPLNENALVP